MTPPLAHAGGWDELALVAVPVLLYGTLHLRRSDPSAALWRRGGPLALGVVLLAAAGALWMGAPGGDPPAGGADRSLLSGLCDAAAAARAGDTAAAGAAFSGQPHRRLHDLARELRQADTATSARLLEAKNAVETALADGRGQLARRLETLLTATRRGLDQLGRPAPACGELAAA